MTPVAAAARPSPRNIFAANRPSTSDDVSDDSGDAFEKDYIYQTASQPSPPSLLTSLTFYKFFYLLRYGYSNILQPADIPSLPPNSRMAVDVAMTKLSEEWDKQVTIAKNKGWLAPYEVSELKKQLSDLQTNSTSKDRGAQEIAALKERIEDALSKKPPSLAKALIQQSFFSFYVSGVFYVLYVIAQVIVPILLQQLLSFLYTGGSDSWVGYTYATGMFVSVMFGAFFQSHGVNMMVESCITARGSLVAMVTKKLIDLSSVERAQLNSGEITNLIAFDSQRLIDTAPLLHYSWSMLLQVFACFGLLIYMVGIYPTLASVGLMAVIFYVVGIILKKQAMLRGEQLKKADKRVKLMTEVLSGIRIIKFYSWEKSFITKINELRQSELETVLKIKVTHSLVMVLLLSLPAILPGLVLLVYCYGGITLTYSKAYTVIAVFNILRMPLILLPMSLSVVIQLFISFNRISDFLILNNEKSDVIERDTDTAAANAYVCFDNVALKWDIDDNNCNSTKRDEKDGKDKNKEKEKKKKKEKGNAKDKDTELENDIEKNDTSSGNDTTTDKSHVALNGDVRIPTNVNSNIHGSLSQGFCLEQMSFSIQGPKLLSIIGPVGSGKSSLLNGILGHMAKTSGRIRLGCRTMSYCPQNPWIINATVRSNVLFNSKMDFDWYNTVIEACQLLPDIGIFENGDATEIGERGINLSGGQKARVALARAVYSRADVYLLDDPLSAVDPYVGEAIFSGVINGLLKDKLRILVTNQLQFVPDSDYIINLGLRETKIASDEVQKSSAESIQTSGSGPVTQPSGGGVKDGDSLSLTAKIGGGSGGGGDSSVSSGHGYVLEQGTFLHLIDNRQSRLFEMMAPYIKNNNIKKIKSNIRNMAIQKTRELNGDVIEASSEKRIYDLQHGRNVHLSTLKNDDDSPSDDDLSDVSSVASDVMNQFIPDFKSLAYNNNLEEQIGAAGERKSKSTWVQSSNKKDVDPPAGPVTREMGPITRDMGPETIIKRQQMLTQGKLIQAEEKTDGGTAWPAFRDYVIAAGSIPAVAIIAATLIVENCFGIFTNYWMGGVWAQNNIPTLTTWSYFLVLLCINVVMIIASFIRLLSFAFRCVRASKTIHNDAAQKIVYARVSFFDVTPLGRIVNRFTRDLDIIDQLLSMNVETICTTSTVLIIIFIVIIVASYFFIPILVVLSIIFYFIQSFFRRSSRELQRIENITRSPIISHFQMLLSGCSTIKAYGMESIFLMKQYTYINNNSRFVYVAQGANRWLQLHLEIIAGIVVYVTALLMVSFRDSISPGLAGLALIYSLQMAMILNFSVRMSTEMEARLSSVEQLTYYGRGEMGIESHYEPVVKSSEGRRRRQKTEVAVVNADAVCAWPSQGTIEFKNVTMRYRKELPLVLRGLTFSIVGGSKIGIVGRTGCGKSSLMNALFRFIEVESGTIMIDGVDCASSNLYTLRKNLTIIPQDPLMFYGTVRFNLDPFDAYSDDEIWRVLENVKLSALINGFDKRLLHMVNEGGTDFSVGQRQQICLARALLRNSKILLLDEATASIDNETDSLIQQTLRENFTHCTVLTIAHRLHTIMESDRILVIDEGQCVENDTPTRLFSKLGGLFRKMVEDANLMDMARSLRKNEKFEREKSRLNLLSRVSNTIENGHSKVNNVGTSSVEDVDSLEEDKRLSITSPTLFQDTHFTETTPMDNH